MQFSPHSIAETNGFTIYWRIENFQYEPDNKVLFLSPVFDIKSLKSQWRMDVGRNEDYLNTYICLKSNSSSMRLTFSTSLLTSLGWVTTSKESCQKFCKTNSWGTNKLLSIQKLEEEPWHYLPNGSLTISYHLWNDEIKNKHYQSLMISRYVNNKKLYHRPIETFSTLKPIDMLSFPPTYEFCQDHLPLKKVKSQSTQTDTDVDLIDEDNLLKFFKEKKFEFVTLRTANSYFSVHKAVLCAHSPVFNAMFDNRMKENDFNLVDIDDIDSQTMTSLVKFLHFEPMVDINWNSAVTLYYAADKYQINSLKNMCVALLNKELSVENVCDAFLLADLHQDKDLMNCAQEYFFENSKFVFLSQNWKDLLLNHPELVAEILHKMADKM